MAELKERFLLFWQKKGQVLIMLVGFFLMLVPQLLYFKLISGSYVFYSYTGESFYFASPHLFDSIFSYRNGWLVYSPLMILSLMGLFFLRKQKAHFTVFILPVVVLYIYILSSWWCWWYVGFGNRAFINLYPILALSLAALIQFILSKKVLIKTSFKLIVMLGLILSVFQSYQFNIGVIHWGAMTKDAYWDSWFRTKSSQLFETLLRFPVTDAQIAGKDLILEPSSSTSYSKHFSFDSEKDCDSSMISGLQYDKFRNGKGAIYLPQGMEFLGKFPVSVNGIDALYISAWVHNLPEQVNLSLSSVEPFYYHASDEVVERSGEWSKIHLHAWVPNYYQGDSVEFVLWNQGKHELVLDDLEIKGLKYSYSEKER
jgi:hypothetical protein